MAQLHDSGSMMMSELSPSPKNVLLCYYTVMDFGRFETALSRNVKRFRVNKTKQVGLRKLMCSIDLSSATVLATTVGKSFSKSSIERVIGLILVN